MKNSWKNHKMPRCPKCSHKLYANGSYFCMSEDRFKPRYRCFNPSCKLNISKIDVEAANDITREEATESRG